MIDWKKLEEDFDNALDNEEYWDKLATKKEIEEKRFDKFEAYLIDNDFEILLDRLLSEHSDDYIDKCYKKGFMPEPNNKLEFLLKYLEERLDAIDTPEWIGNDFSTTTHYYKGYYFSNTFGQGVITRVYDSTKELILQV